VIRFGFGGSPSFFHVIPAKAGIQEAVSSFHAPAFAGVTKVERPMRKLQNKKSPAHLEPGFF
jgi:hypothetical protein